MPVFSISGYKYTTYLDDHSSYGVMFYLKDKSKEFTAFKTYKACAERQLGTTLKCRQFDQGGEFLSNEQKTYTYNITPINQADYETLKELWSSKKPNISHIWVFGCQAWVHIFKRRRHKLEPKSWEMIFVGYEPGSKGCQFWDAAHQCFKISCDVKFKETWFPAKEMTLAQPGPAPLSSCQIPESDNESDSLGPGLVKLAQPPARPICPNHLFLRANLFPHHWPQEE